MPTTSGNYTLPPSYEAVSGETIRVEQHNPPLEDIAQGLTDRLMRNGSSPMSGNLPMGGNRITGLGAATAPGDAVRRDQVALAPGSSVDGNFASFDGATGGIIEDSGTGPADFATAAQGATADAAIPAPAGLTQGDIFTVDGSGDVVRLPKGTASQSLVMNAGATAPVWAGHTSPTGHAIVSGGLITEAHGLPARPRWVTLRLKCITAEFGYSIGDDIFVSSNGSGAADDAANIIQVDATNIYLQFSGNATKHFIVATKTSGVSRHLTNNRWELYLEAGL